MFYFLLAPMVAWHYILIGAAVIPAIFLMRKVYVSDRLEKEDPVFLRQLVLVGVLSTLVAMVLERIGSGILGWFLPYESKAYQLILYFLIVGGAEEGCKFFFLKKCTWNSPHFNCQYDGVVYAVFISLGFALWENISYVLHYGLSTAFVRAVTAVPGHACFGVFMGVFYGIARDAAARGLTEKAKINLIWAVVLPVIMHGAYDYIASTSTEYDYFFLVFILILFTVSYLLVDRSSKADHYIW